MLIIYQRQLLNTTTSKLRKLVGDDIKIKDRYQQIDILLKWTTESQQEEICRKIEEINTSKTKALLHIQDNWKVVRCFAKKKLGIYDTE
jgi:hypothetical protein